MSAAVFIVSLSSARCCSTNARGSVELERFAIADTGCLFAANAGGLETTAAGRVE